VGSDVRRIAADGYPDYNILACELHQVFLDLGYELYNDADTCKIRFFTADALASLPPLHEAPKAQVPLCNVTRLDQLENRITHIFAGQMFHLFGKHEQEELAGTMGRLLKREPGALAFGSQQGLFTEGYLDNVIFG